MRMRFTTITTRFAGSVCRRCKQEIPVGWKIRYGGRGQTWHLKADCDGAAPAETDGEAETDGKTLAAGSDRYVSHYTRFSSGAEVYTNKNGRCEDAPCCGCCT
jgi:hypothetical protein